jgi:hypothetical protein
LTPLVGEERQLLRADHAGDDGQDDRRRGPQVAVDDDPDHAEQGQGEHPGQRSTSGRP